jgi:hypothetical protein
MTVKLPPITRDICGEYKGWNAHVRNGESQCPPCLGAQATYARERRHRNGESKSTLYADDEIAAIKQQAATEARGALSVAALKRCASRRMVRR